MSLSQDKRFARLFTFLCWGLEQFLYQGIFASGSPNSLTLYGYTNRGLTFLTWEELWQGILPALLIIAAQYLSCTVDWCVEVFDSDLSNDWTCFTVYGLSCYLQPISVSFDVFKTFIRCMYEWVYSTRFHWTLHTPLTRFTLLIQFTPIQCLGYIVYIIHIVYYILLWL